MKVITVARKPLEGTVAKNALKHGTGGMNIDKSRLPFAGDDDKWSPATGGSLIYKAYMDGSGQDYQKDHHEPSVLAAEPHEGGRWPANVILTPEAAAALDQQSGLSLSTGGRTANISTTSHIYGGGKGLGQAIDPSEVRGDPGYGDFGGASRYFKVVSE